MADKKPKMGRPRTRPDGLVGIRCEFTPEDHTTVSDAAKAAGKPLGTFARDAVVEAAKKALRGKDGPK